MILGCGMAGTVAAIEAFDTDPTAEVLILEKMPEGLRGGSGRCAGGFLYAPDPKCAEDLKAYHRALSFPNSIPADVLDAWANAVVHQRPWLQRMASDVGMRLVHQSDQTPDFPDLPGARACDHMYKVEGQSGDWQGSGVWRAFFANVERRRIPVIYEAPCVDLIQEPDSLEIFGVIAHEGGLVSAIKARRAVILCTGGFAANRAMQLEYCGYPNMYALGAPGNTGDGVRMLQKAGAELWHMRNFAHVGAIFPGMKFPELDAAFMRESLVASSWIDIAKDNARFYNETYDYGANHFKMELHGNWVDPPFAQVLPIHMIFDEETRVQGKLAKDGLGWNMVALAHEWSDDNSVEVKKGWIVRAESIRDLAIAIGRDPAAVEACVAWYNQHCADGRDPDFGRDPERLKPIVRPPYYAVELFPAIGATPGGGRRTARAEVMATNGMPISRLYEGGELGSTFANLYQNGSYITEAIAFGRIAGRCAANESPWEAAAV